MRSSEFKLPIKVLVAAWLPTAIGIVTFIHLYKNGSTFFGFLLAFWFYASGMALGYSRSLLAYLGLFVLPIIPPILLVSVTHHVGLSQPTAIAYCVMICALFWLLLSKPVRHHVGNRAA